jgi:hypothetical protein
MCDRVTRLDTAYDKVNGMNTFRLEGNLRFFSTQHCIQREYCNEILWKPNPRALLFECVC